MTFARIEAAAPNGVVYKAGQTVSMNSKTFPAFNDAVILGFDESGKHAKVSRPYAYVAGAGTTGASVLLGAETFEIPLAQIAEFWTLVDTWERLR
jgi:hypothetical protein